MQSAWELACLVFERVYSKHEGPEPEAFAAANEAVAPLIPAVREQLAMLGKK